MLFRCVNGRLQQFSCTAAKSREVWEYTKCSFMKLGELSSTILKLSRNTSRNELYTTDCFIRVTAV